MTSALEGLNGNFLFVWNTGSTRKACRKAPRLIFVYFFVLYVLAGFPLVSDGVGFV